MTISYLSKASNTNLSPIGRQPEPLRMKPGILFLSLICLLLKAGAQTCAYPGQTPVTAFLVCGNDPLHQTIPTICGQTTIPTPCGGGNYQNTNPYYFRMACYSAGTLGFIISPDNLNDNFDWQLFDITNSNPYDIFTNPNLFMGCNWSPDPGETGASMDGTNLAVCSSPGLPLFSMMPNLEVGRTYLLMVSDQSGTGGFQLSFEGGSASITDPVEPHINQLTLSCGADKVTAWMSKSIKCSSIAADGSDFTISGGATIIGASTPNCNDFNGNSQIILRLSNPLPAGSYTVSVQNGSDGNTLWDICGMGVAVGEHATFTAGPLTPTLVDSIKPVGCGPSYLDLQFKKPILCNSIAADGSDFVITGPQSVTATVAPANCGGGNTMTTVIRLVLSARLMTGGNYTVKVQNGNDGNTLVDECNLSTPVGSSHTINVKPGVSAAFTYDIHSSCKSDTILFAHDGTGVNSWNWYFDNTPPVTTQNAAIHYSDTIKHTIRLIVTNGVCSDTSSKSLKMPPGIKASFVATPLVVCPGETVQFVNKSTGSIDKWEWDLGNGVRTNLQIPAPQMFIAQTAETIYSIRLITSNTTTNCSDTAHQFVKAASGCFIKVPSAFTPNNDGLNDFLYPLNASKATDMDFLVYDRGGQVVFISHGNSKWDGRIKGVPQNTGLYAWMLTYHDRDTGEKVMMKGITLLIR